jgi:hypothetical protein
MEKRTTWKAKDGKEYEVLSSLRGDYFSGTVMSHLRLPFEVKTLCGKVRGRMTTKYTTFTPALDCKVCARKAGVA